MKKSVRELQEMLILHEDFEKWRYKILTGNKEMLIFIIQKQQASIVEVKADNAITNDDLVDIFL